LAEAAGQSPHRRLAPRRAAPLGLLGGGAPLLLEA
jgi:hypothetical protein